MDQAVRWFHNSGDLTGTRISPQGVVQLKKDQLGRHHNNHHNHNNYHVHNNHHVDNNPIVMFTASTM